MEGRKWEDLNEDCLVQIFGRVGLKALIIALPFVCKSWYKATLNPFCWRILDFQLLQRETSRDINLRFIYPSTKFFKFVVDRSRGTALQILLPKYCSFEALNYIIERCPALTLLNITYIILRKFRDHIPQLISKLKYLEALYLGCNVNSFKEILTQISIHCKNFSTLGITLGKISHEDVSAIVTLLPKIKCLKLSGTFISREDLKLILGVCRELQFMDVSRCLGFEEDDKGILSMAHHIGVFHSKGAMMGDVFLRGRDRTPVAKLVGGSYFC